MGTVKPADEIQGLITSIGRAFFFASYLPSLLFIALHQYALLPALGVSGALLPGVPEVAWLSGELLTTLLLPLFLGMLLVSLNMYITRFFEGTLPWQRSFLLRRWQQANEQKCKLMYGELQELKTAYRDLLQTAVRAESAAAGEMSETPSACLSQTEEDIQAIHEQIETTNSAQPLPFRTHFVRATALGNAFAVFEEYPLDRYGIDSVLFWPRLRQVVDEKLLGMLDNLKMLLDFQLNLSLLALIFSVEAVVVAIVNQTAGWWLAAALALLVARLSYTAAVRVTQSMGTLVNTCFDLYRDKLLEHFGLTQPKKLFEEYKTWLRLGAFVRRGELFYWPDEL